MARANNRLADKIRYFDFLSAVSFLYNFQKTKKKPENQHSAQNGIYRPRPK